MTRDRYWWAFVGLLAAATAAGCWTRAVAQEPALTPAETEGPAAPDVCPPCPPCVGPPVSAATAAALEAIRALKAADDAEAVSPSPD